MRVLLILTLFLFQQKLIGQQTSQTKFLNEMSGYKYKEVIVNSDPVAKNIPIIIGLHWRGSSPDEFEKYLSGLNKPARLILLQGPYPDDEPGFSFFQILPTDYYSLPSDKKMVTLLKEGEKLSVFIRAITSKYKPTQKPIIIGASQGGDLSYVIAIRYNNLISHSYPLLATIDNRVISSSKRNRGKSAPIDAFHGEDDKTINIDVARRHILLLQKNNFKATLHTYENNTHSISDKMKTDYIFLLNTLLE